MFDFVMVSSVIKVFSQYQVKGTISTHEWMKTHDPNVNWQDFSLYLQVVERCKGLRWV